MKLKKTEELKIRIDTDMKLKLERVSFYFDVSLSDVVRFALNNFFTYSDLFMKNFVPTKKD